MSEERVDLTDLLFQVSNVGTSTGTSGEQPEVAELTDGNAAVVEVDAAPTGTSGGTVVLRRGLCGLCTVTWATRKDS